MTYILIGPILTVPIGLALIVVCLSPWRILIGDRAYWFGIDWLLAYSVRIDIDSWRVLIETYELGIDSR